MHLNLLIWLDEMLGYAPDAENLIDTLKSVLEFCRKKELKLNFAIEILSPKSFSSAVALSMNPGSNLILVKI
eukprot:IDg20008t1